MHRLHPLVKLGACLALQVSAFALNSPLALLVLLALPVVGLAIARRSKILIGLIGILAVTGAVWTFFPYANQDLWYSHWFGMVIALKLLAALAPALVIAFTTSPQSLLTALTILRLPMVFVLGVVVMLRFIPAILDEMRLVRDALVLRTAHLSLVYRLASPILYMRAIIVPVILHAYVRGEQLASIAEIRGLDTCAAWPARGRPLVAGVDVMVVLLCIGSIIVALVLR